MIFSNPPRRKESFHLLPLIKNKWLVVNRPFRIDSKYLLSREPRLQAKENIEKLSYSSLYRYEAIRVIETDRGFEIPVQGVSGTGCMQLNTHYNGGSFAVLSFCTAEKIRKGEKRRKKEKCGARDTVTRKAIE